MFIHKYLVLNINSINDNHLNDTVCMYLENYCTVCVSLLFLYQYNKYAKSKSAQQIRTTNELSDNEQVNDSLFPIGCYK